MEDWDTCRAFAKARKEELELKLKIDALQRGRELKLLMVVADCVDAETAAKFMAGTFGNAKDGT